MPSKVRIIQLLLSLLSGVLIFLSGSKFGIGLSPDGISYLSAARYIQQGFQVLDYDGAIFAAWPPLYPCILAFGGAALGDVQEFARLFNVFSGMAITFLVYEFLVQSGVKLFATGLLTFSLLCSFPLLKNGVMLWSESIFIAHLLFFLHLLVRNNNSRLSRCGTLWLLLLGFLLPLQRYLGVAAIITFGVYSMVSTLRSTTLKSHVLKCLSTFTGYSLLLLPLALWCLRNKLLTGHLTGPRAPSTVSLNEIVWRLYDVGAGSLVPVGVTEPFLTPSKCLVCFCVFFALIKVGYCSVTERIKGSSVSLIQNAEVHALFICVYLSVLCLGILGVGLEPLSIRYLSPVIPSVFILVGTQIPTAKRWSSLVMIPLALFTLQSAISCSKLVEVWQEEGAGDYSVRGWKESPTLQWLKQNTISGDVFSNASDFVFIETGQLFSRLPTLASLQNNQFTVTSEMTLVFFARSFRRYMARREDFYQVCSIIPVAQFSDGGVYKCSPIPPNAANTQIP